MRRVSGLEYRARQFLVRRVAPVAFRSLGRVLSVADTRVRRTLTIDRYVSGSGIEIGAGAAPAIVPPGCRVTYVDKYDLATQQSDPELAHLKFRGPDVIDEAEKLSSFADESQDFVLAFSVLEHVQDPLATINAFMRVLRPGGVSIVSVPDKRRYGPDKPRPLTDFEHLVRDFRDGPSVSVADHFREFGSMWYGMKGDELESFVAKQVAEGGHCHFHVWDAESFLAFLSRGREVISKPYDVVEFLTHGVETLVVLRRGAS